MVTHLAVIGTRGHHLPVTTIIIIIITSHLGSTAGPMPSSSLTTPFCCQLFSSSGVRYLWSISVSFIAWKVYFCMSNACLLSSVTGIPFVLGQFYATLAHLLKGTIDQQVHIIRHLASTHHMKVLTAKELYYVSFYLPCYSSCDRR